MMVKHIFKMTPREHLYLNKYGFIVMYNGKKHTWHFQLPALWILLLKMKGESTVPEEYMYRGKMNPM